MRRPSAGGLGDPPQMIFNDPWQPGLEVLTSSVKLNPTLTLTFPSLLEQGSHILFPCPIPP